MLASQLGLGSRRLPRLNRDAATTVPRLAPAKPLLSLVDVHKTFVHRRLHAQPVSAVAGVSLVVTAGDVLGIAGESGCGKSTLSRIMCGLVQPTSGQVLWQGRSLASFDRHAWKDFRRSVQVVFQDPDASLNPRQSIGDIVGRPLVAQGVPRKERRHRVHDVLERVQLTPADRFVSKSPHELSGGGKQRVGIARALVVEPKLLIADEPVASLDMSIRGQVLSLLRDLRETLGISVVLISHDLGVLRAMSSNIAILYLGKVVEQGPVDTVFDRPRHPYTTALLSLASVADPTRARERTKVALEGEVPAASNPPSGCRFHPRCPRALDLCRNDEPPLTWDDRESHLYACHNPVRRTSDS